MIARTQDEQIEKFATLRRLLKTRGTEVGLIADEWCNTLPDIQRFTAASAADFVQIKTPEQIEREEEARRARLNRQLQMQHAEAASFNSPPPEQMPPQQLPPGIGAGGRQPPRGPMPPQQLPPQQPVRAAPKVGRNQPCPCGSGKKFKNCHGVLEGVE